MDIYQVPSFDNFYKVMSERLISMQTELLKPSESIAIVMGQMEHLTSALSKFVIPTNYTLMLETIQNSFSFLAAEMTRVTLEIPPILFSNELSETLRRAIELSSPYMNEELITEAEEFSLQDLPRKRLSLGDMITLISLLFSIFTFIISTLPDEQLTRISQQNAVIIEQNEEMIELLQEDERLTEALNALSDSIDLLTNEVESLRAETDQPSGSEPQNSQTDSQYQDAGRQD